MSDQAPRDSAEPSLGDLLERATTAFRMLTRTVNDVLAEESTREDQWRVMRALRDAEGIVMGDLAIRLVMPPATVTRVIDELVDNSLAFRRQAKTDGRVIAAYLSRQGQEKLERLEAVIEARSDEVTAALARSQNLLSRT
jgi:DNA-binding MarR family transcriptional regulator